MEISATKKFSALLQFRAAVAAIVVAFFVGMVAALDSGIALAFGSVFALIYLIAATVYIPLFSSSVRVKANNETLISDKGAFFKVTAVVPLRSVRYLQLKKTPISVLMNVCKLVLYTSSGRVVIFGIAVSEAEKIEKLINSVITVGR